MSVSAGAISTVSCHLEQNRKSLVGSGLLLKLQNNVFHCHGSTADTTERTGFCPCKMKQSRCLCLSQWSYTTKMLCPEYLHSHCPVLFISALWADTWATVWQIGRLSISFNCQRISHPKCIRSVFVSMQKSRPKAISWKTWPKSVFT